MSSLASIVTFTVPLRLLTDFIVACKETSELTFKSLWMNMSLGSKSYINKQLHNMQDYKLLFPYLRTVVYEFYSGFYGKPDSLKA